MPLDASVATDSNTATPRPADDAVLVGASGGSSPQANTVERALTEATQDATRIGDLLETLRAARLWLPLPDDASAVTASGAVELPTVRYLGSEFVPAYTSAELLIAQARAAAGRDGGQVPHAVVQAADLARLLPPGVGIALNAGATQSVPIYPPGVSFLATDASAAGQDRVSIGPLPAQPEDLLAAIGAGLAGIPQAAEATAAWLSVRFSGEGMIISVALDDPSDDAARDAVVAALERAARAARHDAGYPIDVTFPGESAPDEIDQWIAASAEPFYRRG